MQNTYSAAIDWSGFSFLQRYSGILNALIAVVLFSLTVPMTKLALSIFPVEVIALGRSAVAGTCSLALVLSLGWRFPSRKELVGLLIGGAAVTLIFPYTLSLSLGQWSASNMGVVLAAIPLITAIMAAVIFKERHPLMFWVSVLIGTGVLMHFSWQSAVAGIHYFVIVMLVAAAAGYTAGGYVAKTLGGWKTICWMTVLYLPVSISGLIYTIVDSDFLFDVNFNFSSNIESLLAMAYLAFVSQWLGFHFWYGAMAKVGIGKAGQVQLLQPFFTLLFSVPLLGLVLETHHFFYAGLISIAVVLSVRFKD